MSDIQKTLAAPQKTLSAPTMPGQSGHDGAVGPDAPRPKGAHAPGDTVKAGSKTYTVVKSLGSGGEADIYIVSDKHRQYALKLFRPGFHANTKVLPILQKLKGKGYLTETVDYGDDFELLEYFPEGSAADAGIKGNAQAILAIAVKTAMALDQMHKTGVIHKDVKPANILLKDRTLWDCVLCDFGIADILEDNGLCTTRQVRTPIYAAPEVYDPQNAIFLEGKTYCELTPKADFYSLGMTILSLWLGEGAFQAQERNMAIAKSKGRIAVPTDMPDPLARICRGLLIRDPGKRWDLGEILLTMDGKEVPVDEDLIIEDLNITYNATRHQIANTPEDLASFMAEDQELAKKYLYRGQIERWLQPYPELTLEIQDIVEKRYPKDQDLGIWAVIYLLDPTYTFPLKGTSRENGEKVETRAVTLQDVGDFCNMAIPDTNTFSFLGSEYFREWVRVRNKALAEAFPPDNGDTAVSLIRMQMLDPMADINLVHDPGNPDYAMTGESVGRILNKIYNIFWNKYKGDPEALKNDWDKESNAPLNRLIPLDVIINTVADFLSLPGSHYVTGFFDTKGQRFSQQRSWFVYCTDYDSKDNTKKAGPKDKYFRVQAAWMKVIKGFGTTPEYVFGSTGESVTTLEELFSHSRKELLSEYDKGGLMGFLAVQFQENPDADLSPSFAYEKLLQQYLESLRKINDDILPVQRFDAACKEADNILSTGRARVHGLSISSILQYIATAVFAILPGLLLLTMLGFCIIDNPILDMNGLSLEIFFWPIGLIVAAIIFFTTDTKGCIVPIIGGAIASAVIFMAIKFLGSLILYIFALLVMAVLAFFSIKTVFFQSPYAKRARKFTKPGFDEKVLEPLYFAFSNESSFDSSLNGAFNDYDINNWKDDLRQRRRWMLIFIGTVWILAVFSLFIPKSERFDRFSAPAVQKVQTWFPSLEKVEPLLESRPIKQGDKGEEVLKLQQFLFDKGYTTGKPDGSFGPGTKKAVEEFQKANGLAMTGGAGVKTVERINKIAAKDVKAEKKAARKAEKAKTKEIKEQ